MNEQIADSAADGAVTVVEGLDGLRGTLARPPTEGDEYVELSLDSGERLVVCKQVLERRADGTYFLRLSREDIKGDAIGRSIQSVTLPVAREVLKVGRRVVESGKVSVEITPNVSKHALEIPLVEEYAEVERVPINRIVQETQPVRHEGETTIVPVYEEVVVVERRLMLKEELHISLRKRTRTERREVELRTEEARVVRPES
jgi:uncharacterized protein (TIGR02271 family)